jgi:hypothetical protein
MPELNTKNFMTYLNTDAALVGRSPADASALILLSRSSDASGDARFEG